MSVRPVLVTGAAGFIGANLAIALRAAGHGPVVSVDALTYSGRLENLEPLAHDPGHVFVRADVRDTPRMAALLAAHRPRAVLHLAAESHVDRSIDSARPFVDTNVGGTLSLLEATTTWWRTLAAEERTAFRFLHVSTDEVFGSLGSTDPPFHEDSPARPNSPYAASKAAADHLVRAWHVTYGLPTLNTHCSNNYGPRQFPEKLIPRAIGRAVAGQPVPVYGDGLNVRDWLHVDDHCRALMAVLAGGAPGSTWMVGGEGERSNLEVLHALCAALDALRPQAAPHARLLAFVRDRPGHDRRYAVDATRTRRELGWVPRVGFEPGLRETVAWYLADPARLAGWV